MMSRKQIPLYGTKSDIAAIARAVNSVRPIDFVVMGLFDTPEVTALHDAEEILEFTSYMAFDRGLSLSDRSVPQRDGTVKYAIDPMINKQVVIIRCGGLIGNQRLTSGDVAAVDGGQQAEELYELFAKEIRRRFKRVRSYYVGQEALELFDQGIRLSPTEKSPELYDLAR